MKKIKINVELHELRDKLIGILETGNVSQESQDGALTTYSNCSLEYAKVQDLKAEIKFSCKSYTVSFQ